MPGIGAAALLHGVENSVDSYSTLINIETGTLILQNIQWRHNTGNSALVCVMKNKLLQTVICLPLKKWNWCQIIL